MRRAISLTVLSALIPATTTACFGTFALTRKVYDFNRSVSSDKWVRSLMFLVLVIVPVYEIAALIDALFNNAIEFWGGSSPMNLSAGTTRTALGPDGEVMTMTLRTDGAIDVSILHPDGRLQNMVLSRSGDVVEARDAEGELVARVGDRAGEPVLLAGSAAE
jgi:hypothetical protein